MGKICKTIGDCLPRLGKTKTAGRRRRHHKGKKTLKRTRRHRRSSRR